MHFVWQFFILSAIVMCFEIAYLLKMIDFVTAIWRFP